MNERRQSWLLIAAMFLALVALGATRVLADPDEGRYAEIGRWMLQSGDWLVPRVDGVPFFHKPPYVYWLEAAAIAVFGAHEWSVRLVSAAHALLMLAALYLAAREIGGEALGRRAVLVLGTSMAFLMGGQYVNHDMAVAAWISVAVWAFAFFFMDPRRVALARIGFAACAFGVLSKGLIGLVLPALVLLPWLVVTRRWREIARVPWASGLALFALIVLPWFVVVEQRYPGTLGYLFGTQQFSRYTGTSFNNPRAWWYYLPCLVALLFPWIAFASATLKRGAAGAASEPWRLLAWIWALAIVGFFSLPHSKLIGYVLPAVPPLALLAAMGIGALAEARPRWGRATRVSVLIALVIAGVVQAAAALESRRKSSADIAPLVACATRGEDPIYVLGGFPYDLPFYLRSAKPLIVVADWPLAKRLQLDDWRTELMDGAKFDLVAGAVLKDPDVLYDASVKPNHWVLSMLKEAPRGFTLAWHGRFWGLYRSDATPPSVIDRCLLGDPGTVQARLPTTPR